MTINKPVSIKKNNWKRLRVIVKEKEQPIEISVILTGFWVTIENPLSTLRNIWKLQDKSMIGVEKEQPMEVSVIVTSH